MQNILFWLSRKINYPLVSPQVIQISLTYGCNLRCRMCSIANLLPQEEELSTEQIFHIIDEAKDYGIKEVLLTGGEPFLRKDIFEICEYAHKNGLRSIVTTNGALIDNGLSEKIAKSKASHIHVSLDGLEETNDFFRGSGTFKKITSAINILNQQRRDNHSFSLGIACTVMDKNVKELCEIVKFADSLDVDVINFQPLVSDNANFLDKNLPTFWVKNENIPTLVEEIKKIRQYAPKHITIYEEPQLELLVKYYKRELTRKDWVCFGGFKTIFICYSKNKPLVYSCHGVCGNLDEITLKKAWRSKEAYNLRRHSRRCRELCLQSCYSQYGAQSLSSLIRSSIKKMHRNGK
jgi:MoaA/NifB/PqqE/SkfB family radical SAM enzyme